MITDREDDHDPNRSIVWSRHSTGNPRVRVTAML